MKYTHIFSKQEKKRPFWIYRFSFSHSTHPVTEAGHNYMEVMCIARIWTQPLTFRWVSSGDCMDHTQGIILDKQKKKCIGNISLSDMFRDYTWRSSILSQITRYLNTCKTIYTWSLFWNWNMPLWKRRLTFLWSSCSDSEGGTYSTDPPSPDSVLVYMFKKPKFTWLPLGCLLVHHSSIFLIVVCSM